MIVVCKIFRCTALCPRRVAICTVNQTSISQLHHHQSIIRPLVSTINQSVFPKADPNIICQLLPVVHCSCCCAPSIETIDGYGCGVSTLITHTHLVDRVCLLYGFGRRVNIHSSDIVRCFVREAFFTAVPICIHVYIRTYERTSTTLCRCYVVAGTVKCVWYPRSVRVNSPAKGNILW